MMSEKETGNDGAQKCEKDNNKDEESSEVNEFKFDGRSDGESIAHPAIDASLVLIKDT